MFSPEEIANKKFDKSMGFGYRIETVEEFLLQVADYTTHLEEDKRDLEKKLEILADKLEEYRQDEDSLRAALLGAQKLGDGVIRESKTKAEIILRDATIKAEKMIENARRQIEIEQFNLTKMQKEVANFKARLFALYRQHLELVGALPGAEEDGLRVPQVPHGRSEPKIDIPLDDDTTMADHASQEEEPLTEQNGEEDNDFTQEDLATAGAKGEGRERESRFGPLKFGEGFGLVREDEQPRKKK